MNLSASSSSVKPSTAATTYVTIPISGSDVISRSIQNFSVTLSRRRPWPEFFSTGVLDRPDSFSAAASRLQKNAAYFRVNYAVIVSACGAISLLGRPISLLVVGLIVFLWLILHFFREDPLIAWGYQVGDRAVLMGLCLVSIASIWGIGDVGNLVLGIGVGLLICAVHGVFRNPDGLFLEETEAEAAGLIGSVPV